MRKQTVYMSKQQYDLIVNSFEEMDYSCGADGWIPSSDDINNILIPFYDSMAEARKKARRDGVTERSFVRRQQKIVLFFLWMFVTARGIPAEQCESIESFLATHLIVENRKYTKDLFYSPDEEDDEDDTCGEFYDEIDEDEPNVVNIEREEGADDLNADLLD